MENQTITTKIGIFTIDEIYSLADKITQGKSRCSKSVFKELKARTGIPMTKLQPLFKVRLSDDEIVESLKRSPPDTDIFKKCSEVKRLCLGQVKCCDCFKALFRSLQSG